MVAVTRTMRDGVSPAGISHKGLDMVAGYVNGAYAWSASDWAMFPGMPHVRIDVTGGLPEVSDVLDVETGDADVPGAVRWVAWRRHHHPDWVNVVYSNRATLTPLFDGMGIAGYTVGRDFHLWVATLDGVKTLPDMTGVVAVQWLNTPGYDESAVYDDAWFRPAATAALPKNDPKVADMIIINPLNPKGLPWPGTFVWDGASPPVHIASWGDQEAFAKILPVVEVSWAQWVLIRDAIPADGPETAVVVPASGPAAAAGPSGAAPVPSAPLPGPPVAGPPPGAPAVGPSSVPGVS